MIACICNCSITWLQLQWSKRIESIRTAERRVVRGNVTTIDHEDTHNPLLVFIMDLVHLQSGGHHKVSHG